MSNYLQIWLLISKGVHHYIVLGTPRDQVLIKYNICVDLSLCPLNLWGRVALAEIHVSVSNTYVRISDFCTSVLAYFHLLSWKIRYYSGIKGTYSDNWCYMLVYVDDCFLVHHNPDSVMNDLKTQYTMKGDYFGQPEQYVGSNVWKWTIKNGILWCINSGNYVKEACKMVKKWSEEAAHR